MFSKALFKQSCKANGTMWAIITFATCFMLACVMLISGNGNIGAVKNSIQDTIITKEVDSQMQSRALSYYSNAEDGLEFFDKEFTADVKDTLSYLTWLSRMPSADDFSDPSVYGAAMSVWQDSVPELKTSTGEAYAADITEWNNARPQETAFDNSADYIAALTEWNALSPATQENAVKTAYTAACADLQTYVLNRAAALGYAESSSEAQEMLGSVMYALNPNGTFDSFYEECGESSPEDYDVTSIITSIVSGNAEDYIVSSDREEYRQDRAEAYASVFIAGNMVKPDNVSALIEALSSYGVSKEKYDSFGYNYASIKHISKTAIVTYRGRVEYELEELDKELSGGTLSEDAYSAAVVAKKEEIASSVSLSFLETLPDTVSEALEEIGQADLYTLVVGSIFYKLAGLLLPIIYMIMASNNLVAGQVDSGSMAYVLSTSTKRNTVVFTQAVYLIGSIAAMFALTTVTGCVCLAIVTEDVALTYGNLILLNIGAFLVLFALSGLCFLTSCVFDRSKRAMSVGGGLSIFALVAAMLGLFGSPVIPSVVRLDALNYFNYTTIISLFDVISIMDGTTAFVWKFFILLALGIVGYVIGSVRFTKKDLPL